MVLGWTDLDGCIKRWHAETFQIPIHFRDCEVTCTEFEDPGTTFVLAKQRQCMVKKTQIQQKKHQCIVIKKTQIQ